MRTIRQEILVQWVDLYLGALRQREQDIFKFLAILAPALGAFVYLITLPHIYGVYDPVISTGTIGIQFLLFLGAWYAAALGFNYRSILLQLIKVCAEAKVLDVKLKRWPRDVVSYPSHMCHLGKIYICDPPEVIGVFYWSFIGALLLVTLISSTAFAWWFALTGFLAFTLCLASPIWYGRKIVNICKREGEIMSDEEDIPRVTELGTNKQEIDSRLAISFRNSTLVVAAASAFVYWVAYRYEMGYTSFFGMPAQLISVDLSTVLYSLLTLSSYIGIFYILFWVFLPAVASIRHPVARYLLSPTISILAFGVVPAVIYGRSFAFHLIVWVPVIYLVWILCPIIFNRKIKGFAAKVEDYNSFASKHTLSLFKFDDAKTWSTFMILLLYIWFAKDIGVSHAKDQTDFMLLRDTSQTLLVVRVYGDNLVCAPVDTMTRKVTPSFQILNKGNLRGSTLDECNIGCLTARIRETRGPASPTNP